MTTATHASHQAVHGFWRTYVFSTDHKTIAKQYLTLGVLWLVVGGLLAGAMRWQLARPDTPIPLVTPPGGDSQGGISLF